jgi:hypothetical protein
MIGLARESGASYQNNPAPRQSGLAGSRYEWHDNPGAAVEKR